MKYCTDIPLCESDDAFAWDPNEVRDLIQTTPLRFDDDGQPTGYAAEQFFGLEDIGVLGHLSISRHSIGKDSK